MAREATEKVEGSLGKADVSVGNGRGNNRGAEILSQLINTFL